jgi:hypothetical protein
MKYAGRRRENIIIVILCVFYLYIWVRYFNPTVMKLTDERDNLIK